MSCSSESGLEKKHQSRRVSEQHPSLVSHCPEVLAGDRSEPWHPVLHGALRTTPCPAAGHRGCMFPLLTAGKVCREQHGAVVYGTELQPALELLLGTTGLFILFSWVIAAGCSVIASTCCTAAPFSITLQLLGCSASSLSGLGWEQRFWVKRRMWLSRLWSAHCSSLLCGVLGRCM